MARTGRGRKPDHRVRRRQLLERELYDEASDGEVPAGRTKRAKGSSNPGKDKEGIQPHGTIPEEDKEVMRTWGGLTRNTGAGADHPNDDDDDNSNNTLLPILTRTGKWRVSGRKMASAPSEASSSARQRQQDESDASSGAEEDGEHDGGSDSDATHSHSQPPPPTICIEDVKRELAAKALALTEDPESSIGLLREMLDYCQVRGAGREGQRGAAPPPPLPVPITRLALLSVLAVFKDILPGYHIRPLTETERTATVSKDVRKSRSYEEAVLNYYTRFWGICKAIIMPVRGTGRRRSYWAQDSALLSTALRCVHELMAFASHFNHFEDILKVAIHALTLPWEGEVERTCQALRSLFASDEEGQVSAMAMRMLSTLIKERAYDCPPIWLTALETVRIRTSNDGRGASRGRRDAGRVNSTVPGGKAKPGKKHMSGRAKKEWKAKQEELQRATEAEAATSQEQMTKYSREVLKHLFRIYFGILKENPRPALLPAVLGGLSRHAHRIGVEYFVDLLQSLRQLMEPRGTISKQEEGEIDLVPALHCILTVDRIYAINENLAAMDLKFVYNSLYRQLLRMQRDPKKWSWEEVANPLQACLSSLFHPKRILPAVRTAAFVQRLVDVAQALLRASGVEGEAPLKSFVGPAAFMLDHVKGLLTHQVKTRDVLDPEPFGQGAYRIDSDDPDLSNPFARPMLSILEGLKAGPSPPKIKMLVNEIATLRP